MAYLLNNKELGGVYAGRDFSEKGDGAPDPPADTPTQASLINFCHVVH